MVTIVLEVLVACDILCFDEGFVNCNGVVT